MKKLILIAILALSANTSTAQEMPSSNNQDYINYNITQFGEQRKAGKFLQIAGSAGAIVGALVAAPVVAGAAGVLTLAGFIVDVDASRHIIGKNISKQPSLLSKEEIAAFHSKQQKKEEERHAEFRKSKKYKKYLKRSEGKSQKAKRRMYFNAYNNWGLFRY